MSYYEEAGEVLKVLKRQGQAFIKINLVGYANDVDFGSNPPSCRITVTASDPTPDKKDPTHGQKVVSADIPTTTPPYSHQFTVVVQTTAKSLGRFIGFPQHRSLNIDIKAEPINGFEQWYEADAAITGLTIAAGDSIERNVSLKPKYDGSRLNQHTYINKPVLRKPEA